LDLGIGHGIVANIFSNNFDDYTVIDGSPSVIKNYKKNYPDSRAKIICTYFENYDTDDRYDLIIMGFILEHVADPVLILNQYKNYLKANGRIVIVVPNAESMHRRLGVYMGILNDIAKLSEHDHTLGHRRYFTSKSIKDILAQAFLAVETIEGIFLKPFTTSQMSSLGLDKNILDALCQLAVLYPDISNAIYVEAKPL
jgi:2-polyprenyl-3-methyl-5-hydroxy-6-metoxy-1,4-benzoquinol methylase